jgi:putative peptidoglycan lipid II flippase
MWRSANAVISGLIASAAVVTGFAILGVTLVISAVPMAQNTRLMLELLRIMFPYMLLVCLASVFMGVLNARGYFFVPALGAAMLNVVMIASVLLLAPRMGRSLATQIFGLAIGVLLAGVAQAGFQLPSLRREGFRYRWVSPWRDETVREVVRKMLPASVGVAAFQINVLITQGLAFGVHAPIVAAFQYAVRLMEFPQGVFGISLATYLLPTLSGLAVEKKYLEFRATLRQGLAYLIFVNLLAAALLLTLAEPMIRLLFEHGRFTPGSTAEVSAALACLAPGLVCFSSVNILARAFYALGDTRTPMRISVFCLALNLLFVVLFLPTFRAAGLGVANTLSSIFNAACLTYGLRRKLGRLEWGSLRAGLAASVGAAVLAGLVAWVLAAWWARHFGYASVVLRLGHVLLPLSAASLLYLGVSWWARVPAATEVIGLLRRRAK